MEAIPVLNPRVVAFAVITVRTRRPTWPAQCGLSIRRMYGSVKLMCTGKLDTLHLLKAFEDGADAVLVAG